MISLIIEQGFKLEYLLLDVLLFVFLQCTYHLGRFSFLEFVKGYIIAKHNKPNKEFDLGKRYSSYGGRGGKGGGTKYVPRNMKRLLDYFEDEVYDYDKEIVGTALMRHDYTVKTMSSLNNSAVRAVAIKIKSYCGYVKYNPDFPAASNFNHMSGKKVRNELINILNYSKEACLMNHPQ